MERVRNTCVFCPGNEAMTMEEVMRVTYGEIYDGTSMPAGFYADDWAIRVVRNIIPRVPEECTGGKNESYVIIEDGRHFLPDATGLSDLMWSGALPAQHYYHVFRVAAEVVRRSMANTTVKSVLIRKHQGRESGASQPHIHIQAIGADRIFPDVERDLEVTAQHPHIWQECVDLMRELGFHLEEGDGIASHWSPFGKFGRHFEVISLQDWQPLPDIPDTRLAPVCAVYAPPAAGPGDGAARPGNPPRRGHSAAPAPQRPALCLRQHRRDAELPDRCG